MLRLSDLIYDYTMCLKWIPAEAVWNFMSQADFTKVQNVQQARCAVLCACDELSGIKCSVNPSKNACV